MPDTPTPSPEQVQGLRLLTNEGHVVARCDQTGKVFTVPDRTTALQQRDERIAELERVADVAQAMMADCSACADMLWDGEIPEYERCEVEGSCSYARLREALDALTAVKSQAVPTTSEDM